MLMERFVQSPDQIKLDFETQTVIEGATVRADQPKAGDKEFQFCVTIVGASMSDRSAIFNYFQTNTPLTIKLSETPTGKKKSKASKPAEDKPSEGDGKEHTISEQPAPAGDGPSEGEAPTISRADLIDLALRRALSPITDLRVAGETPNPMTDSEISIALKHAWGDPQTGFCEGFHYSAYGSQGAKKEPRFWLSEVIEISTNVTSKPTLAGQALISKIRQLLDIPLPSKRVATGRRGMIH